MRSGGFQLLCAGVIAGAMVASGPVFATAQQPVKPSPAPRAQPHGEHGMPAGWKFSWPNGTPAKGRVVFLKLECYSCHEVKGEKFPGR